MIEPIKLKYKKLSSGFFAILFEFISLLHCMPAVSLSNIFFFPPQHWTIFLQLNLLINEGLYKDLTSFSVFNKPGSYSHGHIDCHSSKPIAIFIKFHHCFESKICLFQKYLQLFNSITEFKGFFFKSQKDCWWMLESWCFVIIISDGRAKFRLPAQADRSL